MTHSHSQKDLSAEVVQPQPGDLPVPIDAAAELLDVEGSLQEDVPDDARLMDRLDRRQNEVLAELDQLNLRIERLVVSWQKQREQERAA